MENVQVKTYVWKKAPKGLIFLQQLTGELADGMPTDEAEILGGVDTSNGYSMGWGMLSGQKRELLLRYKEAQAKDDVEEYLIFKGIIPAAGLSPSTTAQHEKSV